MEGLSEKQIEILRYLYSNSEKVFTYEELKSAVPCTSSQILFELSQKYLIHWDGVGTQKIKILSDGEARIEEIDARIKWEKEQDEYHQKSYLQTQEAIRISKKTFWITLIAGIITCLGVLWAIWEWLFPIIVK